MGKGWHRFVLICNKKKYYFDYNEYFYGKCLRCGSIMTRRKFPIEKVEIIEKVQAILIEERGLFNYKKYLPEALEKAIKDFWAGGVDIVFWRGEVILSRY
jgi:hypothetical protein